MNLINILWTFLIGLCLLWGCIAVAVFIFAFVRAIYMLIFKRGGNDGK